MRSRLFNTTFAIFLAIILIAPSAFLIAPQKAHAIPVGIVEDVPTWVNTAISVVQNTIAASASVTSSAALIALQIDAYILQPLAFVLSGNLLKAMTAGTIAFVIGKANGTGVPQFVADIQTSLQTVSDTHTLAFLDQYVRSSQSPYAGSIISALSKEYLNKTSLAGFWAQNMDTLRRTSPNITGYLNGNWALGGVGAWFALTTQNQNNPYMLYPGAQGQLAALIGVGAGGATGARLADLAHGGGFVSWCGSSDGFLGSMSTGAISGANAAAVDQAANDAYDQAYNNAIAAGNESGAVQLATDAAATAKADAFNRAKAVNAGNTVLGVSPGDPCTNADGTTGTIKTPGSVIVAGLNKALGGQQDNVVRMGNVGPQINQILGNIGQVLKTVQFATQILGGPGSGGLLGVDTPTSGRTTSALNQYANSSGNLGATNSTVLSSAAALPFSGTSMLDRLSQYETAIDSIRGSVNTASTNVASLISFCTAQQQVASSTLANGNPTDLANLKSFISDSTVQINTAQTVLATQIEPTLVRIYTASTSIKNAHAMVLKVQTALNSGLGGGDSSVDLQTLQTMPPSAKDLANAQQDAVTPSITTAVANPSGSLNVSGTFLIERLNLISANALALHPICTAPKPTFSRTGL